MPGRPPLKGLFSVNFKHGTIKASNRSLRTKLPICRSCFSEPAAQGEFNQDGTVQDASCNEAKHGSESGATVEETVATPGFSTIAIVDQPTSSLTWQDPEEYMKWWSASSDSTLRDGLIGGFTYFMDDIDSEWLQSYNAGRLGERIGLEHERRVAVAEISEDIFEFVMGLFEMITRFAEQFGLTHNVKQLKKNSTYATLQLSEFDAILSAPLNPTIFISGKAPSWLPLPKSLLKVACSIYEHWQQRKLERQGLRLIPVIERDFHKKPPLGYACFAPRPLRNELWWSSATRLADLPPALVPLLERSLSQIWDDHLRSISKIRDEVPAVNARYAFNQFRKFCKDDVAPLVADMQNASAPSYQREETRKALTLEILAKDLKVVHDHENLVSVQRVNEYLKDHAERTGMLNVTLPKPQPKQKNVTRKVKLKTTKRTWTTQPKLGKFSSIIAHNSRIIKPGCPPVSPPFSTLRDGNKIGTKSGRWVIRIGPRSQNYRPLTMAYLNDNQDTSAPPTPSTSYEVFSPTVVDSLKPGLDLALVSSPSQGDIPGVSELQTSPDRNKRVSTPQSVSAVVALSEQVLNGQALENEKELSTQTPSSSTSVSPGSQRSSVASTSAPVLNSATPVTFGSQVHQNVSFSFAVSAKQGAPTAKSPCLNGSLSAPASLGSVDHTMTPMVPPKVPPKTPKAGAKQRRETGRPPRKRARTGAHPVTDENLPDTV